jgi:hypothetical protein
MMNEWLVIHKTTIRSKETDLGERINGNGEEEKSFRAFKDCKVSRGQQPELLHKTRRSLNADLQGLSAVRTLSLLNNR